MVSLNWIEDPDGIDDDDDDDDDGRVKKRRD